MLSIRVFALVLALWSASTSGKSLRREQKPQWDNRGQIVFLGDSITDWWKNDGIATWNQFYEPLGSVNTGVAGDRTSTIINRINNEGIINNLNAYMAVLKIGTNDLSGNVPVQTVVENIGTILALIKDRNPGAKTLLLGILPRGDGDAGLHTRVREVNTLMANYANGNDVFYLDMEAQFSTGLGVVIPELYWADQLHLSSRGYEVWAETMNPLFNQILGSPFLAKAVWIGDSLSSQWLSFGAQTWNTHYSQVASLNVAVSGHTTVDTIDIIERVGVLNDLNSKVAVLMIGGNDLQRGTQAPQIIANIERIIALIKSKLPHERILLLALLPAGGKPEPILEQGKLVNAALAQMANDDDIHFLEMTYEFADENEAIHEELYQADQTHLSALGYELWQRLMDPLFQELLKF